MRLSAFQPFLGYRLTPRLRASRSMFPVHAAIRDQRTAHLQDEVETKARQVRLLEAQADEAHTEAQRHNKQQNFAAAALAYKRMHALEDQASILAKEVGCVACVLGDPACAALSGLTPEEESLYFQPQPLPPWPLQAAGQLQERAQGAVLGSLLADAAAMGVHWIYDLEQLASLHAARLDPAANSTGAPALGVACSSDVGLEFMEPPLSPFYSYPSGSNSPYGEQTLVLLHGLSARKAFDACSYANDFAEYFGETFCGYRDVSTKGFLRNHGRGLAPPQTGAADAQANAIARAAPLVAGWAGTPGLVPIVQAATRVTQNTDAAAAWAAVGAAVLERVVLGEAPSVAVRAVVTELRGSAGGGRLNCGALATEIAGHLETALDLAARPVPDVVALLGRNCHMPNALTTPIHCVLHMEHLARVGARQLAERDGEAGGHAGQPTSAGSQQGGGVESNGSELPSSLCMGGGGPWGQQLAASLGARYAQGVRLAIREGGCCASRAAYTGAVLGALAGTQGLPLEWQDKHMAFAKVQAAVAGMCTARARL